jgi:hypothetical protein
VPPCTPRYEEEALDQAVSGQPSRLACCELSALGAACMPNSALGVFLPSGRQPAATELPHFSHPPTSPACHWRC